MDYLLLTEAAAQTATTGTESGLSGLFGGMGIWPTLIYAAIFIAFMYFILIRPQKKEQKRQKEMMSSMEIGDSVVTTGGFYGVIIDVTEEDVIVEFGSNKNCRIPMKKTAIAQIEKANTQ